MYRSKDSTFPDFSKSNDEVGELFFNVRNILLLHTPWHALIPYLRQTLSRRMELPLWSSTSSRNASNISHMGFLFPSATIFIISISKKTKLMMIREAILWTSSFALPIPLLQKPRVHMIRVVFQMNSNLSNSPRLPGLQIQKDFSIRFIWSILLLHVTVDLIFALLFLALSRKLQ